MSAVDAADNGANQRSKRADAKSDVGGRFEYLKFLASAPRARAIGADFYEPRFDVGLRYLPSGVAGASGIVPGSGSQMRVSHCHRPPH